MAATGLREFACKRPKEAAGARLRVTAEDATDGCPTVGNRRIPCQKNKKAARIWTALCLRFLRESNPSFDLERVTS